MKNIIFFNHIGAKRTKKERLRGEGVGIRTRMVIGKQFPPAKRMVNNCLTLHVATFMDESGSFRHIGILPGFRFPNGPPLSHCSPPKWPGINTKPVRPRPSITRVNQSHRNLGRSGGQKRSNYNLTL